MELRRSSRLQHLVQSDIRTMTRECVAVSGINLGQGVCDMPTPPLVRDAAIEAIQDRKSLYSYPEGIVEIRELIAEKLERDNKLKADPNKQITVTIGATGAFACTLVGLMEPGDGILIFEPYYGYHLNCAIASGMKPQFIPLEAPSFEITEAAIEAAITPESKAIIICTPANPSGKMWTRTELEIIDRVASKHDLLVITDEIYEYIRYDGREHISPATVGNLAERTVTIMGLSKTFSITGWRLGYAIAPEHMSPAITLVNDLYYVCSPTPLQHGVAAGFKSPQSYFDDLQTTYQKKRDLFCGTLTKIGFTPIIPEGAYYVLCDVSKLGHNDSKAAAMQILNEAKVAGVPGRSFYQSELGKDIVRFCFAAEDEAIEKAAQQLAKAFG